MNSRSVRVILILSVMVAVWLLWPRHARPVAPVKPIPQPVAAKTTVAQPVAAVHSASTSPNALIRPAHSIATTNKFAWRLTNTTKSLRELTHDSHALLLANALIDTHAPFNLAIPKNLQSAGDPGAYIVQANTLINANFRATLALAGVQIVSYIPNNAYLVQATASQAAALASSGLYVLAYEPYYKLSSGLIAAAATGQPLSPTTLLNVGAFANDGPAVLAAIQKDGGIVVGQDQSPFGPIYRVSPPADWPAIAQIPGVQVVEPTYRRMEANDLSRVALGVSTDTLTPTNYLNLYGSNVLVEVNDSGIDATHPDFTLGGTPAKGPGSGTRIFGDSPASLLDTNGHGTFVAGIIAGNGAKSWSPTNVGVYASGSVSNADFRGKAPLADLFSVGFFGDYDTPYNIAAGTYNPDIYNTSDYYLQSVPALTNALISNNSWTYSGDNAYDLAAASYDAAVRDALPKVPGSQPVLFVFAAGDDGSGNDSGSGALADSIESPATAKNVITVGALQQDRNITNIVTDEYGNSNDVWAAETASSTYVADYSARGNVGVGVEGDFGRFKPDVVAPGNFVVSTRSAQWNEQNYYNPTNYTTYYYSDQFVTEGQFDDFSAYVPYNAVGMFIQLIANAQSPEPFPTNLPIYVSATSASPGPGTNDFFGFNYVSSPPQGGATYIDNLQDTFINFSVGGSTNFPAPYDLSYDVAITFIETNDLGNYFEVLSNLNDSLGPFYRYESGTSMSAPAVSGVLALMQDFFTNTLHASPSPALLKAMLINGARAVGTYQFSVTNTPNDQGWGLPNLPNSLPPVLTNLVTTPNPVSTPYYFLDQSPTNALATGDSATFKVAVSPAAQADPLRVTLVWTDPPGDPAAAIKLVNNLDIIVTNLDTTNVYYGNNFSSAGNPNYSVAATTNEVPAFDMVNNVRNIFLPSGLGTNYTVTVYGRSVNVNAVTAQTNNVVQDYALVISSGDAFNSDSNALTITGPTLVQNPTADQDFTIVTSTNNAPLLNQIAGENSPLLGTNTVGIGTNSVLGTNGLITVGQTNQWHFYMVTNFTSYTNGAFITFFPEEMAVSRMGTLSDSVSDATRPEGDIDLYVAKEGGLTNLDPVVISNCVNGVGGDAVSAGQGGTEYVAYSNSTPGQIYYIGVKSEDHLGVVYGFLPVFSAYPFSSMNSDGSESINGVNLPVTIPVGTPKNPGTALVFALGLYPVTIDQLVVTNQVWHQNFGDLFGVLTHDTITDVLNNHDAFGDTIGAVPLIYYDDPNNPINTPVGPFTVAPVQKSDGPGSLVNYRGQPAIGPWILTEADNAYVQTGSVVAFGLRAFPHTPADKGLDVYIAAGSMFADYVDVPAGVTNFTLSVTNETLPPNNPPLQLYLRFGAVPTPEGANPTQYDAMTIISNPAPPFVSGSITVTPTSIPPLNPGRYYFEIYNPSSDPATNVYIIATFGYSAVSGSATFGSTSVPTSLLDDAVATNTIVITNTDNIYSAAVGVVVDHPRVSDLVLTLISPLNQRYTLIENRGGDTANFGHLNITTNFFGTASAGSQLGNTNVIGPVPDEGTLLINYNMYTVPDDLQVYYDGAVIFDSGYVSGAGQFVVNYGPGTDTNITIVMDQGGDSHGSSAWTYTPAVVAENYSYLTFTDDTNLADIPIKFAIPPFNLADLGTNFLLGDFDTATNGDYVGLTNIYDPFGGFTVPTNLFGAGTNIITLTNNEVSIVTDPQNSFLGSNYLALGLGTITRTIPTIPNRQYTITYAYRGPGIAGWWRGEGNALDSANPETNGNNGFLIGRFTFPQGEVGQAFDLTDQGSLYQFAGTNNYVQIPAGPSLNVGTGSGLTVEGWINPTNLSTQQPLVEWLAAPTTNAVGTNIHVVAGPFLNRGTGHFYYLLAATNWTVSEQWATNFGGHLVTINDADEQAWVYDTFADYGGTNRDLWIGLNDATNAGTYVWTSGQVVPYFNWQTGQPDDCSGNEHYAVIPGGTNLLAGLWRVENQLGEYCTNGVLDRILTNATYGVVELDSIPTNGVQFWVSVTNSPATGNSILSSNGCLYANLVDTTNGYHEIWSAPGLVQSNVFQHVALTYNTNSGVASLYYNGTNVCSTNLGVFTPKTTGDILLGKDMTLATNNFYSGKLDEMSVYARALSDAEIAGIYEISAWSTNNTLTNYVFSSNGKFDPAFNPALGLAVATVTLGTRTNLIVGANTNWQLINYTFTATSNSVPFQFTGISPGVLLDDISVTEAAVGNLYYQPEQPLTGLVGESAAGTWTLEILDNRAGDTNALAKLVSWQLQFVLQTNTPVPATLYPQMPATNTVPPGDIAYFYVPIPSWAGYATNILVSSTAPVNLLFNPTVPPTGTGVGDLDLLANSTGGIGTPVLQTNTPPLLTDYYYLGVQNTGTAPATFVVRVDFDTTALSNSVPFVNTLTTNDTVQYYSFDVSTNNPVEATFQLLKLSGKASLVASYGTPLPNPTNFAYGSFNGSNADQNIYIVTNSSPTPLTPGVWYLGVFRNDTNAVTYTVLAKELDAGQTNIITLTNNVPFNFTAGPGAALTNFFVFPVTNAAQNIHFELFNLTGNGDLTVGSNSPPMLPPFYDSSQEPGLVPEYIYLRTNSALTNLTGNWYLGVPNHETNLIHFTILAVNDSLLITNTVLAFPGAVGAAAYATGGHGSTNIYHVTSLADSGPGTLRQGVNLYTNGATIVFDVSGNIPLLSPLVITNSNLTIAGQTAPGGGVTLQNYPTLLQGANNVIIRYLRFRPGDTATNLSVSNSAAGDSLAFTNALNVMVDHVSASWSTNAVMAVLNSSNITVQWSFIADSLYQTNVMPGYGSILRYGGGSLSFNHNLYADDFSGSPLLGDDVVLDFVNNVIYNWGILPGWSITNDVVDDPSGFTNKLNYACNYVLASTNSQTNYIAFWAGSTNTWIFQTNNFIDGYTNVVTNIVAAISATNSPTTNVVYVLNGANTGWSMFTTNATEFGDPFPLPYAGITNATVPTASAEEAYLAYERVLDFAGDQLSRDSVDLTLVGNVRTQVGTFISSQNQAGGWPAISSAPTPLDTDQDGLPDYWEITFGLNPTNAADGENLVTNTGYTELETYLNWLASPHALTSGTNPVSVDLYQLAGGTGELSFSVTNAFNGTVVLTNEVGVNGVVIRSNSIAIFTPTNGYTSSFTNPASFDFYVTNNDTVAWFGPVTVSVVVSATNILTSPGIIDLTNGVPYTFTSTTNNTNSSLAAALDVFRFTTTNSPGAIVFQLYALSSPAGLVLQTNGLPVGPNYLAASGSTGTNPVEILVQTNFALTNIGSVNFSNLNNQWYMGVTNAGTNAITYTIEAEEIPTAPTIINLTNDVPFTFSAAPGQDLTNFFRFTVTDSPSAVQFQLYNMNGNGDLTVLTNALPFAPDFYQASQQPGTTPEFIQVSTNGGPTNLNANWYLGVPNNDPGVITYTILAQEITNTYAITTNGPTTNVVAASSTNFYLVDVPQYAIQATNTLVSATGPVSVWFTTNNPPTGGAANDAELLAGPSGSAVVGTNATPELTGSAQMTQGGFYYLAVVNRGSTPVTAVLSVTFNYVAPPLQAPSVVTEPAIPVTAFVATLQASVVPEGAATTVYFTYGLTAGYGLTSGSVVLTTNLYSTYPVGINVTNLLPGTTYHFEAVAVNSAGTRYGGDLTLTTPPGAPTVTTVAATNITPTTATMQAVVSPNAAATTVYFEYGTDTSYGSVTPATNLPTLTTQTIGINTTGLVPGTVYHFQAVGFNSAGTNYGGDLTFTNLAELPAVTTEAVTNLTSTSAKLQALVDPNGGPTTLYFEFGTNATYGNDTGTRLLSTNLNTPQLVGLFVGGLLPGVLYHYQAVASNNIGVSLGGDLTFTTPAAPPTVITLAATNVIGTNATVSASVTPNGAATTVYFEYGATTNYGFLTGVSVLSSNLDTAQIVSSLLTNLQAGVNYHYQAIAFNSIGTNYGGDLTLNVPMATVTVNFNSIIATNGGYLLTWYAPTNDQFQVQWSTSLLTSNWNTFTNFVVYTGPLTATNGLFSYFDNGSQSGGFGTFRYYRLELIPPLLPPSGLVYYVNPLTTLVVTNGATDPNPNAVLTYTVTGSLSGTNVPTVNPNGVVSWTPTLAQAGLTNIITTIATQSGATPVTAANSFIAVVNPLPYFTSITVTVDGILLRWVAASSNQFQVGWTTNLLTPFTFVPANPPYLTSPTTNFFYVDTNSAVMKFYELRQLP